jgi:hypothetical protein
MGNAESSEVRQSDPETKNLEELFLHVTQMGDAPQRGLLLQDHDSSAELFWNSSPWVTEACLGTQPAVNSLAFFLTSLFN